MNRHSDAANQHELHTATEQAAEQALEIGRSHLLDRGFTAFTARSAWRQHESGVDVVNF